MGQSSALLRPLVDSLARHVMDGVTGHADDTPVSVLDPGRGRTKIARLWAYVRDDRPAAGPAPPAVWFQYTPDRKGEHPARHLRAFHGILQADGYLTEVIRRIAHHPVNRVNELLPWNLAQEMGAAREPEQKAA